jgi:hypothetical protein
VCLCVCGGSYLAVLLPVRVHVGFPGLHQVAYAVVVCLVVMGQAQDHQADENEEHHLHAIKRHAMHEVMSCDVM